MPTPVSVSFGQVRIHFDGATEEFGSSIVVIETLQCRGEIAHHLWQIGPESQRAPKCFGSFCKFPQLV